MELSRDSGFLPRGIPGGMKSFFGYFGASQFHMLTRQIADVDRSTELLYSQVDIIEYSTAAVFLVL